MWQNLGVLSFYEMCICAFLGLHAFLIALYATRFVVLLYQVNMNREKAQLSSRKRKPPLQTMVVVGSGENSCLALGAPVNNSVQFVPIHSNLWTNCSNSVQPVFLKKNCTELMGGLEWIVHICTELYRFGHNWTGNCSSLFTVVQGSKCTDRSVRLLLLL